MPLNRYHIGFRVQGFPVFLSGQPRRWQPLQKLGLAFLLAGAALLAPAREAAPPASVAVAELPVEAQQTQSRILAGGPHPYRKDGSVFGNFERRLPGQPRGYYREYTVRTPGVDDRGARRIVCGGRQPTQPDACFYTEDHYASFRRIAP